MEKNNFTEKVNFSDIASEIEKMVHVDQEMRKKRLQDDNYWDENIDKEHTENMKTIIKKIGWPTISKVGEEISHSAWLLVQHADHDVSFQLYCLDLMRQQPNGEVSKKDIAYLEDRVRVNQHKPQLYGTQFFEEEGKDIPFPIENPELVDARRLEMGLSSLEEGITAIYKKYNES